MDNYLTLATEKYVRFMKQKRYSESTIIQYCSYVEKLSILDSRLYRLSNNQIQDFILESNSASAQNCKINALKLFFKINNPRKRINVFIRPRSEKRLIEILSINEVWQIIDSIKHIKQKAIISGIYLHGLRRSEILNLKYENIDRERNLITIKEGKGKKDRFVPLNSIWIEYLTKYAKSENHKKGYGKPIFYPYSASSMSNVLKSKAKLLGIKKRVYIHLLRDSFASHLLEQNIDARFIQEILGHSKITTTQKYLHVSAINISNIALRKVS
jgi:integrase/recombinase XerD